MSQTGLTLREFKSISLVKLMSIARKLKEKYPNQVNRIDYIVDELTMKIQNLRVYTLTDYLSTLYFLSREFEEFSELIPDEKIIKELIERGKKKRCT
ncbi:MAG: hypothetical protein QW607_08460 [Desulfurococcaceae archaeon]